MPITISNLQLENVKRVKAVTMRPSATGLTIIGGNNRQGKTSVLDAIAWALGGESFRPTAPEREGSAIPPYLKITLSNGLIVERKGKNSALKVTDPSGAKAGQQLLDSFVEKLALNLPKFMESSDKEKAATLLKIIGVGDRLAALEKSEKETYSERQALGRIADQKNKFAKEMPFYPDAPEEPVSAADLIKEQQEILARNGQRMQWRRDYDAILDERMRVDDQIHECEYRLHELEEKMLELDRRAVEAMKTPNEMKMESTAEIEASIENIDEINRKVRANLDKAKAEDDARNYSRQYDELTVSIESIRKDKAELLNSADLPLPGLSVSDGSLIYNGCHWDGMSGAEQLKVATAIVRKLNPECGFVLMDKLEQMDKETLNEFGAWLEAEGLQVIATRVSTGEECSIIITDGTAVETEPEPEVPAVNDWRNFEL